jgi:hypothetical protein
MEVRMKLTLVSTLVTTIAASWGGPAEAMTGYKWKSRPLVVFAPTPGDPQLERQRRIVASLRPAFIDRSMVIVYVVGDRVTADLGQRPGLPAKALRERYGVAAGVFKVLLVGKDGGVKLTSSKPIAGPTLFRTIDAMPMRADEIRRAPNRAPAQR